MHIYRQIVMTFLNKPQRGVIVMKIRWYLHDMLFSYNRSLFNWEWYNYFIVIIPEIRPKLCVFFTLYIAFI